MTKRIVLVIVALALALGLAGWKWQTPPHKEAGWTWDDSAQPYWVDE